MKTLEPILPLDVHDYKRKWLPGHTVRLHSDLDVRGKDWCRKNMKRHEWSFTAYTDVYEHTFHFETLENSVKFMENFEKKFVNMQKSA